MKPMLPQKQDEGSVLKKQPDAKLERRQPAPRRRRRTIIDGPFTESKELLGGSWPPGAKRR